MKWAFAVLLCAGAMANVAAKDSDNWETVTDDDVLRASYRRSVRQPLDSIEPISVEMTGEKDADGYPIGDIYYNEGTGCENIANRYRYYPSMVYGVRGKGYGESSNVFNPVVLYTHPIHNKKEDVYDYGWINGTEGKHIPSFVEWLDASKTTVRGACGKKKIGTFKEILKAAKDASYYRARLTIDRQLYSTELLEGENVNNGTPIWTEYTDKTRVGRAYYYLYLSEPMKQNGYACDGNNCPAKKGTYYYDEDNTLYSFNFNVGIQYYAWTTLEEQYRRWYYSNGKYVAGLWSVKDYSSCLSYEYGQNPYDECPSIYGASVKRKDVVYEGDSLIEFRLAGITVIAEGPTYNAAHGMRVYDTTYSDIIKLVPKYKINFVNSSFGYPNNDVDANTCSKEEIAGTKCSYSVAARSGYEFKCWATDEAGKNCVSTENLIELTVRHDTTLYAVYTREPLTVTMNAANWNHTYNDGYDHVRGRDSVRFYGTVSGTTNTAYFACEYRDASNTTWKRLGDIQEIPASAIASGRSVYIDIDKAGEVVCSYNAITVLGKEKLSKTDSTEFRFALSYNSDMIDAVYSDINYVQPRFPVVFRDTNYKVVYDKPAKWGESVKFPTNAELKIPDDEVEDGIFYHYTWWDIPLDMDRQCRSINTQAESWSFESTLDSLNCFPMVLKGYRVKFIGAGDTVLKDTIVKEIFVGNSVTPTYTPVPEVPKYEGLRFKGWDHEVNSLNNITNVTEPMIVKALFDSLYYVSFIDLVAGKTLKSDTLDYGESPTEIPEVPEYADYTFKEWTEDATKIKRPLEGMGHYANVYAVYDVPENKEFKFTVSGIGTAKMLDDIKVEHNLNECFDVSQELAVGGERPQEITGYMSYRFAIKVNPKDTYECIDDSLVKVWNYFERLEGWAGYSKWPVIVNGVDVSRNTWIYGSDSVVVNYGLYEVWFVDDDRERTVLKKELVGEGLSATPPKDPKREGYVFVGWDTDDFDYVTEEMMVVAQYEEVESSSSEAKSSSSEAKSSSSKNKSSSSSSKGKDSKSSSSKGGKDAIVAVQQIPQFSLVAMGRDIQVAGARMGSAYAVFDMQGHVMVKGRVAAANFDVPVSRAGSYLVRIGNQVQKVNVR